MSERRRVSSGSPYEPRIGFSRAVRVALETVSLADMALPRMQTIRMPGLQERTP